MSTIHLTIAFAGKHQQIIEHFDVPAGSRLRDAIELSGIRERLPEIDLAKHCVGIYGRIATLETPLHPGDRVEIYRALEIDPKDIRRRRAGLRAARR